MARERIKFEKHFNVTDLKKEFGVKFKKNCPFCDNDYIYVKRNINYIDKNFFISAYTECGVCGARGPLCGEFVHKRDEDVENELVKKAVKAWNDGVYYKSGEFND